MSISKRVLIGALALCLVAGTIALVRSKRGDVGAAAVITAAARWRTLAVPAALEANRQGFAFVSLGSTVFVFGGEHYDSTSKQRGALKDGFIGPQADGSWTPTAAAPTTDGLAGVAAVWTGKVVVVVGTPCPTITNETFDEPAPCPVGHPTILTYDPNADEWSTNTNSVAGVTPSSISAVGWNGEHAVFMLNDASDTADAGEAHDVPMVVDPANGSISFGAPVASGNSCISDLGDAELGLAYNYKGTLSANDPRVDPNFHDSPTAVQAVGTAVTLYELAKEQWRSPVEVPSSFHASSISPQLSCGGPNMLLLNSTPFSGVALDLASSKWTTIVAPPAQPPENPGYVIWTGDSFLFWTDARTRSAPAIALDPTSGSWSRTAVPSPAAPIARSAPLSRGGAIAWVLADPGHSPLLSLK